MRRFFWDGSDGKSVTNSGRRTGPKKCQRQRHQQVGKDEDRDHQAFLPGSFQAESKGNFMKDSGGCSERLGGGKVRWSVIFGKLNGRGRRRVCQQLGRQVGLRMMLMFFKRFLTKA